MLHARQPYQQHYNDGHADSALIATMIEADLKNAEQLFELEAIQLAQALADSDPRPPFPANAPIQPIRLAPERQTELVAMRAALTTAQNNLSLNAIDRLREREEADARFARALEVSFSAATKKERLDREFARVLQMADEKGEEDIDEVMKRGVEGVLGLAKVQEFMVSRYKGRCTTVMNS